MIWTFGLLNAEEGEYSFTFLAHGGINCLLDLINLDLFMPSITNINPSETPSLAEEKEWRELETVTVYALTSCLKVCEVPPQGNIFNSTVKN